MDMSAAGMAVQTRAGRGGRRRGFDDKRRERDIGREKIKEGKGIKEHEK